MASINLIKGSDGTGNAATAIVSTLRAPSASTLIVSTVDNIPATFYASMGTPHTFTDPVTGETITVISEATAVDFRGHVDGINLEIDAIAPGYTDAGSAVGDIIVIRPITEWANNVADVMANEHKDDGTHGDITCDSITINGTALAEGWSPLGATPNTITANGNRSYDLVFNSTDLTDTISPGMRIKTTRTTTAPTNAFSLDGTNDYYNDTTVSGMTFTDDFVAGAWVYLTNYSANEMAIASRFNGSSGWWFTVKPTSFGCVAQLAGFNGSISNFKAVQSYQSIPLNRWVHISAQLDMSAHTYSSTQSYIMLDGVYVPGQVTQGGSNPAALIQAGNFEIGSMNGGTSPFPGYIDQAFVTSAKMTQANVKVIMNQAWTSALCTTHSVVSAYSNGSTTDINTTNANNLTAQNGATTVAKSPFATNGFGTSTGTTDYGIVQKAVFSTNTTLTVQVPEGCTIPTSGGVSAVAYSTQKSPFGFVGDKGRWSIYSLLMSSTLFTATPGTWYNPSGFGIHAPVGSWDITFNAIIRGGYSSAGGSFTQIHAGFSTTSAVSPYTTGHSISTSSVSIDAGVGPSLVTNSTTNNMSIESTTLTVYYLNFMINTGGTTYANQSGIYCNTLVPAKIILEPSLL